MWKRGLPGALYSSGLLRRLLLPPRLLVRSLGLMTSGRPQRGASILSRVCWFMTPVTLRPASCWNSLKDRINYKVYNNWKKHKREYIAKRVYKDLTMEDNVVTVETGVLYLNSKFKKTHDIVPVDKLYWYLTSVKPNSLIKYLMIPKGVWQNTLAINAWSWTIVMETITIQELNKPVPFGTPHTFSTILNPSSVGVSRVVTNDTSTEHSILFCNR